MDKRARKAIHEIAATFGLNSKSVGAGKSRFPTLIKTSRVREFDEDRFSQIESQVNRGFFPRMDKMSRSKGGKAAKTPRGGRGGASSAGVTYRDGDIVGATAPEIGIDNRGRAMLEKMGWSKGDALGALNNKGITNPIAHVVKNSKAGLG